MIHAAKEDLTDHYEELRRQALRQPGVNPGLGLALLRRQGMRCWIESWSKCAPPPHPTREDSSTHSIPLELHGELANILAGMALGRRQWEVNP